MFIYLCLKDIQAEIDSHNDIFKSADGNKSKMVKALGSSEEAVFLQHRLDDMNQRWSDLKAKSASIRSENLQLISAVLMSSVYAAQNSELFFTGETKSDSNVMLLSVLPL